MWGLDRFSAHSTPAASGRSSPAPRRSLQVQRPGLAPRSSSLSLYSHNNSSSHLPSAARAPVSSGLKNQIYGAPPENVEDPVAVFERLIKSTLSNIDASDAGDSVTKPDDITGEIDFGGLSLEEFVRGEESDMRSNGTAVTSHVQHSATSVEEYETEKSRLEDLHRSIEEADTVLQSVEKHLASFQADLSKVSAEIETLQSRSAVLNARLETRRNVEKLLGPHVEQVALSPAVVKKISEGPIDEAWTKALEELQARIKALDTGKTEAAKTKAATDLRPLLDDLSNRAVERIRDHFAAKIRAMRSPNINAQVLQQNDFLRFKSLFAFLAQRQSQLSEEILQAYVNTMRWYYGTHFTRYRDALVKLKAYTTDKVDTLGDEPGRAGTAKASSASPHPTPDLFNLGRRNDILRRPTSSALPASTAEEAKSTVYLEVPFLHYNLALLDNVTSEYTFLSSFLPSPPSGPFGAQKVSRALTVIFGPAFDIGSSLTKSLTGDSYDALALLLCIRLTQHFAFTTQRRRIPTLDNYLNGMSILLWPRFQQILDAHNDSLKRQTAAMPSRTGGGAGNAASAAFASLAGGSNQPSSASTAPHAITQRFANLLRGILALSTETRDDEPVGNSVARLRECFEAWISKMAQSFGAGEKGRRERERFLQSNHGLVTAVLAGDDVKGKLADDCRAHFEGTRGVVGGQ